MSFYRIDLIMIVLEAKALYFSYEQKNIIQNWSHLLQSEEICHLKGLNGSGKSTLLKLLSGILLPLSGEVITYLQKSFVYPFAYVGHQLGLHPYLTINQNLRLGLIDDTWSLEDLLESAQLIAVQDTPVQFLSVGQRQKVAFIRMMMQKSMIWLLDEPFANLDEFGEAWLWTHIDKHLAKGGSVILTAHQRDLEHEGVVVWQLS
jgi:heme exporter protein A